MKLLRYLIIFFFFKFFKLSFAKDPSALINEIVDEEHQYYQMKQRFVQLLKLNRMYTLHISKSDTLLMGRNVYFKESKNLNIKNYLKLFLKSFSRD